MKTQQAAVRWAGAWALVLAVAWPWLRERWAAPGLLYGQAFYSVQRTATPVLVVVVHGGSPAHQPDYQYKLAQQVAQATTDVVAVGVLRLGYVDPAGHRSPGWRGLTTGDNYTPAAVEALAATVRALRRRYQARRVVLVGHSGGAVLVGDVLGHDPVLADAAVLAACPCNVRAFRQHMARRQRNPLWWQPVPLLSPQDVVGGVRPGLRVSVVTGLADPVALPVYSQRYVAALRARRVAARLLELPGQGHEILLTPPVLAEIKRLVAAVER